ncbi:MAG: hypothetical protein J5762_02535 [Clostridia bacterium]|nr:hypothetical protein [Clostridia bacterium]
MKAIKNLLAIAIVIALALTCTLAGCAGNNAKTTDEPAASSPAGEPASETETSSSDEGGNGGEETITDPYLVIGWYAKTATSGLTEDLMTGFVGDLKTWLATKGATEDDLKKVVVRAYGDGEANSVADVSTAVLADGDVDLLLGMKAMGDIVRIEGATGLTMGGVSGRNISRLTDTEVTVNAYKWLVANVANIAATEYVTGSIEPVEQNEETENSSGENSGTSDTQSGEESGSGEGEQEARTNYLVIAWYAKTSTSGLTEELVTSFVDELKTYLATQGATNEQLADVIVRAYGDGDANSVAEVGAAVNADGDVDVILGMGNNITSTGGIACEQRTDANLVMGTATKRIIARLTTADIAKTAYDWMVDNASLLVPAAE